jgi:hypothetical protein
MLSHIFSLGTLYAKPPVLPQSNDGCLLTFPNYVTGSLIGVECTYDKRTEVGTLLKLAHAERYYKSAPQAVISEHKAAEMLGIRPSTLRGWVAKGWIYRWIGSNYEYVFSAFEVQALQIARPRTLQSPRPKRPLQRKLTVQVAQSKNWIITEEEDPDDWCCPF